MAIIQRERNKVMLMTVCTIVYFMIAAETTVAGLILVDLLQAYPHHKTLLSWLSGVNISMGPMCSVLIGYIISKFPLHRVGILGSLLSSGAMIIAACSANPVVLFVTFGVTCGLCKGIYYIIPPVRLQKCLANHRNLSQGIMFASHSLCFLFYPAVVRFLLDHFTWRGMLLIQAGINLHTIPCYLLMRDPWSDHVASKPTSKCHKDGTNTPEKVQLSKSAGQKKIIRAYETELEIVNISKNLKVDDNCLQIDKQELEKDITNITPETQAATFLQLFREKPVFLPFILGIVAIQSGNIIPFTLTPLQAVQLGTTKLKGAMLISIAAGISLVGRVVFGYVGDRPWSNPLLMGAVGGILGGTLTAIIPVLVQYDHLAVVVAAIALPSACFMATWAGAVTLVVGRQHLVYAMSSGFTAFGLAMILPFSVTGWLLDLTGNPEYIFLSFGIFEAMGGFIFLVTYLYIKWKNNTLNQHR